MMFAKRHHAWRFHEKFVTPVLIGTALSWCPIAAAQTPGQSVNPDVVVKGRLPPTRKDVQRQAQAVSEAEDHFDEALARFSAPVCPASVGLPRELAEPLIDRVRYDAQQAGMRLASSDNCTPNVAIVFVHNGQDEIRALIRAHSPAFDGLASADRRKLVDDAGPVHVWRRTSVRGRDGDTQQPGAGIDAPMLAVTSPSHILLSTRIDLNSAIMVVNVPAIDGMSVKQIADYAAMRLFAPTHAPAGGARVDTILALFDSGDMPPAEMTAFDRGYLRNLYHAQTGQPAYATIGTRIDIPGSDAQDAKAGSPPR